MQRCNQCGAIIPVGSRDCVKCGSGVSAGKCSKCGIPVPSGSNLCSRCKAVSQGHPTRIKPNNTGCHNCGAPIQPGRRTCTECGAILRVSSPIGAAQKEEIDIAHHKTDKPVNKGCHNCGAPIQPGRKTCTECGAILRVSSQNQSPREVLNTKERLNTRNAAEQASAGSGLNDHKFSSELFSYGSLIIDQKVRAFSIGDAYGIYTEDGTSVGFIIQDQISSGAAAVQVLFGKGMSQYQSYSASIYDNKNKCVGKISSSGPGGISRFDRAFDVLDPSGDLIGTYYKDKVTGRSGEVIASMRNSGLRNYEFVNGDGQLIATLRHKWDGVAKELFTTADKYVVSFSAGISEGQKSVILSICAIFDFLTAVH